MIKKWYALPFLDTFEKKRITTQMDIITINEAISFLYFATVTTRRKTRVFILILKIIALLYIKSLLMTEVIVNNKPVSFC